MLNLNLFGLHVYCMMFVLVNHTYGFVPYVTALDLGKTQSVDDNLRDACLGALFVINNLDKDVDVQQREDGSGSTASFLKSENHIMISYQHKSQDIMLKVKKLLEKNGYTVWMDVDEMSNVK